MGYYFYDLENEEVTMSIPFSYLQQNVSAEQLLLQYKESPHTPLSITSLTQDESVGYTLIARTPSNFNYEELRLKHASDNKYLFYFPD